MPLFLHGRLVWLCFFFVMMITSLSWLHSDHLHLFPAHNYLPGSNHDMNCSKINLVDWVRKLTNLQMKVDSVYCVAMLLDWKLSIQGPNNTQCIATYSHLQCFQRKTSQFRKTCEFDINSNTITFHYSWVSDSSYICNTLSFSWAHMKSILCWVRQG